MLLSRLVRRLRRPRRRDAGAEGLGHQPGHRDPRDPGGDPHRAGPPRPPPRRDRRPGDPRGPALGRGHVAALRRLRRRRGADPRRGLGPAAGRGHGDGAAGDRDGLVRARGLRRHRRSGWPIGYDLVPVSAAAAAEVPLFAGHRWAEPRAAELAAAMREVHERPAEARGTRRRRRGSGSSATTIAPSRGSPSAAWPSSTAGRARPRPSTTTCRGSWSRAASRASRRSSGVNREIARALIRRGDVDLALVDTDGDADRPGGPRDGRRSRPPRGTCCRAGPTSSSARCSRRASAGPPRGGWCRCSTGSSVPCRPTGCG